MDQPMRKTLESAAPAFTLIELLVVVAIIALLISILLPALNRAREIAKQSVCLTQSRNMTLAVHMYADANGVFPSAGSSHGGQTGDVARSWVVQLVNEYGRQNDILRCPSDRSKHWLNAPVAFDDLEALEDLPPNTRLTSYASNGYTAYSVGDLPIFNNWNLIEHPDRTVFWTEVAEDGEYASADHVHPETWWFAPEAQAGEQMALARHHGKAVYGLLDGHAEALTFSDTYELDPNSGFPPKFLTNLYHPELAQ